MNSDKKDRFKELVKNIGPVDQLSAEQLTEISRNLFDIVSLEEDVNACDRFYYRDYEHSSACMYCQKRMLLYYLGRCMEKLANDGRLPRFDEAWLTRAKIRDRTYEHIKFGSELIFRIDRHRNAWRDETRMEIIIQTWVFDFTDMSLKELSYYAYLIGIPIRRLTESKSEWRGTAAQLHVELKNIAKVLKINTKSNLWPTSSYRLNRILQELKEYFEGFGITIVRQRDIKIIKKPTEATH
jgi:hypothetical protein